MDAKTDRITTLLEKILREELTPDEQDELDAWLAENEQHKILYAQLTNKEDLLKRLHQYELTDSNSIWEKTMRKIRKDAAVVEMPRTKTKIRRFKWLKPAAAAAAIIVVVGGAVYFFAMPRNNADHTAQSVEPAQSTPDFKVEPGTDKAILTLADGSAIQLDKTPDGPLPRQGTIAVSKTGGHLNYGRFVPNGSVSTGPAEYDSLHNLVSTPRGGQYQLTLPDGSKVWLNAASSLRFPLAFAGNQRTVELTGEAYFEVASRLMETANGAKTKMPFIVHIVSPSGAGVMSQVEVLGTHFNVTAYEEDKRITTTLLEGSVIMREGNNARKLKPGQQAIAQSGQIAVNKVDDVTDAIAWKDGYIALNGSTQDILNQIARWYNVEVEYAGNIPEKKVPAGFEGKIPRNSDVQTIIDVLDQFNIHTRLDKNKIIVTP